ncbi:MAG: DUF455 family protein [Acidobacteriota bacterium]
MNVEAFARRILESGDLDSKVRPAPRRWLAERLQGATGQGPLHPDWRSSPESFAPAPQRPARAPELEMVPVRKAPVPSLEGYHDPAQRRRILHALANHELQAAELFAWALLAFPNAPPGFRQGLLKVLDDEQRHTRMYVARLEAQGGRFGEHRVSGHFWNKIDGINSPAAFVCAMSLTFENANLDHTREIAAAARAAGDEKSAQVVEQVQRDEIEHVRFGWTWLARLKDPESSMWSAYRDHLAPPLHPGRASGRGTFRRQERRAAGLDEDFLDSLEQAHGATGARGQRVASMPGDGPGDRPVEGPGAGSQNETGTQMTDVEAQPAPSPQPAKG